MFDWTLFLLLLLISLPGLLLSVPPVVARLRTTVTAQGQDLPPAPVLLGLSLLQSLVVVAVPAAAGIWLAPRVGLEAPVLQAIAAGQWPREAVRAALLPTLAWSAAGAILFVAAYYGFFRRRLDPETRYYSETLRMELGMPARLLYGGIVEEIIARWGLTTFFVWAGLKVTGAASAGVMWGAIVIAGIFFGLGHLPSYKMAGARATPAFLSYMLVLNLWASLVCGWLFWHYGLWAAMVAHMAFHLVWMPFDYRFYRREAPPAAAQSASV